MQLTIRQKILQAADKPRYPVAVPEWCEDTLSIATLSAADRDDYEQWAFGDDRSNYRAKLVCRALVDAGGQRVFSDDDAPALGTKSAAVVSRLFDVAVQANGLLKSDVEDLEKNCAGAASDASDSGSPSPGAVPTPNNSSKP